MKTQKILFKAGGKDYKVTITGKQESIDHVIEALAIRQEIDKVAEERQEKDLELTRAFKNQFQKADEINEKYGHE